MSRGLECPDRDQALRLLRAVGYYRLSAYVYPFRELLPEAERCRTSPVQYRGDRILAGVSFQHIQGLWRFDRKLRLRVLDGLELVEVGLRAKIAYVAGRRHTFAQVTRAVLDETSCAKRRTGLGRKPVDGFAEWMARYAKLQADAKYEDFVRHHLSKYGDPLPVCIAVEFLDFGALTRLYGLLDRKDQNEIAGELGLAGGTLLGSWLKSLNYVRNVAAHHNRLWNRTLTYQMRCFALPQVAERLHHIRRAHPRDKVYVPLAVTAYLVGHVESGSRWPVILRDEVTAFPDVPYLSPENDMGFPVGWAAEALWTQSHSRRTHWPTSSETGR